ncbi:hypothetical protein BvCmsHHNP022_00691 [Escherichia coli]|nr:hypothetical protein BvCmsHHNP027_02164 [Escherichia coli]GCS18346.1 hypothetical protein BvCmsHHNP022_00691 [Escherichia coli]
MVTLKAHILPHHDLQPPGCRGSLALIFLKFAQPDNKKEDINKQSNFLFMFNYLMEYAKYYLLVARIIQIRLFYRDYQGLD